MEFLDKLGIEQEEELYNAYLEDVGLSDNVTIGVVLFKDSYEVFADHWDKTATKYFRTFQEALDYCKQEYPDADWDVLG